MEDLRVSLLFISLNLHPGCPEPRGQGLVKCVPAGAPPSCHAQLAAPVAAQKCVTGMSQPAQDLWPLGNHTALTPAS